MRSIVSFFNENAGAIQAFCAFVIAAMTVAYVAFTRRMWHEMRQTNERLEKANLQALLELKRPTLMYLFQLTIRNAGGVPVTDLRVEVSPKNVPAGRALSDFNFFNRVIPVLAERESISVLLPRQMFGIILESDNTTISFDLSYNASNQRLRQAYKYDLSIYKDLSIRSESDDTLRKTIEDGLRTLGSTLVGNQREISYRLEWGTILTPALDNTDEGLRTLLNCFPAAWIDYKFLDGRGLDRFTDHKMRVLCEQLYDALCSHGDHDGEYRELRQSLLRMAREDYRDQKEYVALGDMAALIVKQISQDRPDLLDLLISTPWG